MFTLLFALLGAASAQDTGFDDEDIIVIEADREQEGVDEEVLSVEDIQVLPGTGGDVVRVVQNLPGVARPPLNIGQLIVRGTAPEDSAAYLDGLRIPLVFHFSGLTTVVNGDALEEVAFQPGGFGVRYGRILGGLVDLRTSLVRPEQRESYASVDVYQATAYSTWPVGERGAVTVSGRRSWVDAVLNPILNQGERTVQAPRYWDGQARGVWESERGATWDAFLLASDDRFRVLGSDAPDASTEIGLSTTFQKLRLRRLQPFGDGWLYESSLLAGPSREAFTFDGDGTAWEDELLVGVRQELYRVAEQGYPGWRFGLDVEGGQDSYLYDVPGFGERELGETWLFAPGAYAEGSFVFGRLSLTPGLRGDLLASEEGTLAALDPRLAVRHQLRERFALKATAGQHSQFPETRQLLGEGDGNPDLGPSHALQTSLGAEQELGPWTLGVTGFWHELYDLVSGREDAFAFFSGPPATGPFDTDPYANDGTGRVIGVESLVRLDADDTIALVSATLSLSTRIDRPGGDEELFRYDQPLVVNALVSHELNQRWRLGARARLSSGYAYTPVDNRWVDLDTQTFVPVYGDADSARLPPFFSLDVRVDRSWAFRAWELTAYLDVQNATNATNPEVMSWSYDFSEEEPVQSTPILPAFGLRAAW